MVALSEWSKEIITAVGRVIVTLALACGSFYLLRLAIPDQAAALVAVVLIWVYFVIIGKLIKPRN